MTSFGWKKKRQLTGHTASIFADSDGEEGEGGEAENDGEVDWLGAAKRRKAMLLEDNLTKSKRLQDEGATLAEEDRYWEAIKYWNEALELNPRSAVLYEMKSQALSELGELYPAVEAAEKAVMVEPTWSIAWQTLARAQIGLGEIEMALSSAQKSMHIDPTNSEVREDLGWIQELIKRKTALSKELSSKEEEKRSEILKKRRGIQDQENEDSPPNNLKSDS